MKVSRLIEILSMFDQDFTVDIGMKSDYPNTVNAERVLADSVRRCVVVEADD